MLPTPLLYTIVVVIVVQIWTKTMTEIMERREQFVYPCTGKISEKIIEIKICCSRLLSISQHVSQLGGTNWYLTQLSHTWLHSIRYGVLVIFCFQVYVADTYCEIDLAHDFSVPAKIILPLIGNKYVWLSIIFILSFTKSSGTYFRLEWVS
jgi:hypothetical protein